MFCSSRVAALIIGLAVFASGWLSTDAQAQRPRARLAPAPANLTVSTKDGVEIGLTYFESLGGQEAVPVVMLPDWKDARNVYDSLARKLQQPGEKDNYPSFAVVTVDLRGHGASTKQKLPTGATRELDAAKLGREDFTNMITYDMEAVRKFLVEKNDLQKLNLNKLVLLGAGMGATVATNWAAVDWSAPPLAVKKQGQDVKGLILISPEWKWHGVTMQEAIRQPGVRQQVSLMIMFGSRDRKIAADAKRIFSQVERYHPEPKSANDKPRNLVVLPADNALQGTQLLKEAGAAGEAKIIEFLRLHVVEAEYAWMSRKVQ